MKNKFIALIIAAVFFVVAPMAYAETEAHPENSQKTAEETPIFKDIVQGNDYFTAIQYLAKANLIDNKEEYFLDKELGRAETIYYIFKIILGYAPDKNLKLNAKPFKDVPAESVLAPYIKQARELKIISANEKFYPHKKVVLAEVVKMALETEKLINASILFEQPAENVFSDVSSDVWFSSYAKIAKEKRIIKFGRSDEMEPSQIVTKGYLMEILYRIIRSRENAMFGIASYYHRTLNGAKTSSGEIFSNKLFTAAHRTLPFGTRLRVTNLRNGKSVEVVINDRGPYTKNFTLDLSQTAFEVLAPRSQGIIPTEYVIIQ